MAREGLPPTYLWCGWFQCCEEANGRCETSQPGSPHQLLHSSPPSEPWPTSSRAVTVPGAGPIPAMCSNMPCVRRADTALAAWIARPEVPPHPVIPARFTYHRPPPGSARSGTASLAICTRAIAFVNSRTCPRPRSDEGPIKLHVHFRTAGGQSSYLIHCGECINVRSQ